MWYGVPVSGMAARPRRTLQYAPGDTRSKVQAAADSDADAVIIDLESTVDPAAKDRARDNLASFLDEIAFDDKEIVVRINGLRTDRWVDDLGAALAAGADTIRLPKIEEPEEVIRAVDRANEMGEDRPEFLIQLESPAGVLNGREIAVACADLSQVTGIGVGIGDYTKTLGLDDHTPELRSFLLNRTAAYAAVGNMDPLAYVHKDLDTLRAAATLAKSLGHVGQPVSHTVDIDAFVDVLHDVYDA